MQVCICCISVFCIPLIHSMRASVSIFTYNEFFKQIHFTDCQQHTNKSIVTGVVAIKKKYFQLYVLFVILMIAGTRTHHTAEKTFFKWWPPFGCCYVKPMPKYIVCIFRRCMHGYGKPQQIHNNKYLNKICAHV